MEILSNSIFHGETTFKNRVTFENSEFHTSDVAFREGTYVTFNGSVNFSDNASPVSFGAGLYPTKLLSGDLKFVLPYWSGDKGTYTLATTRDLCGRAGYVVIDVPEVPADCTVFKLTDGCLGGNIPLSIQMFKKDTTIKSFAPSNIWGIGWIPVQVDFYTDQSMGLCEIIVKKSSSFGIETGTHQIRATYYHP